MQFPLLPVVNYKGQLLGVVVMENLPTGTGSIDFGCRELEVTRENERPGNESMEISPHDLFRRTLTLRQAGIITYSPNMLELIDLCSRAAKVTSTVLLCGESGVGKELLAKLIHTSSPRAAARFIEINCGAIPESLMESELFGYAAGAFTGASRHGKCGMFELADGGTLFLDEIGELPLALQVKLLRAIQTQEFVRIGDTKARKVDIRFIAATNRDLEQMVAQGRFREDLFFRLNVISMYVPPLRQRKEDILPLVHHFQAKYSLQFGNVKSFSTEALRRLQGYSWPGNVRELENVVECLMAIGPEGIIEDKHLPKRLLQVNTETCIKVNGVMPLSQAVDILQRMLIGEALATYGDISRAAEALQVDPSTLSRKLARFRKNSKCKRD